MTAVFEPRWRYSGSAIAFNVAAIIGGGPAPALATIIAGKGHITWVAAYIAVACLLTVGAVVGLGRWGRGSISRTGEDEELCFAD